MIDAVLSHNAAELHALLRQKLGSAHATHSLVAAGVLANASATVGASIEFVEGEGTVEEFAANWARAALALMMFGQALLTDDGMVKAVEDQTAEMREKYSTEATEAT